jgi:hypothetical protein
VESVPISGQRSGASNKQEFSAPQLTTMPASHRLARSLGLGFFLIYLAFLAPGIYSIDGNSMLNVAESIVTRHDLTVAPGLGITGRGGQVYSSWYPLQSLLAAPLVALAVPFSRAFHVPLHFMAAVFASILPVIFTAASVSLVSLIALQLGSSLDGARRAAICFALGTIALVYHRTFYAEPLLMFLTAATMYLAFAQTPRTVLVASICALLVVLAKPTGILVGPVLSAYLLAKQTLPVRFRLAPGLGAVFGLLLYFLYNWVRFADPFIFGQPYAFSFVSIPTGVAGLLVSPGRGLIWYCPPVVLAVLGLWKAAQGRRLEALSIVALFAAFLGLHSFWTAWSGGWSWGPRFLLPVLPGLLASTGLLEGRLKRSLVALAVAGFLINTPTLVSYYERYYAEANEQHIPEHVLLWSPSHSPILHVWGAAARVISDAANNDVNELFRHTGAPSPTISESRALRVVALWWWVLPIVHIPRAVGAALSLLMVFCGSWIVFRIPRHERPLCS